MSNSVTPHSQLLTETKLTRSVLMVWVLFVFLAAFLAWAWFYKLDEVTTGNGKVIPSGHEQIVQSLEGGIIYQLNVKEGDVVEQGQVVAQLDRTKTESGVQESLSRQHAAEATAARLQAEVNGTPLVFPAELSDEPGLIHDETQLYESRLTSLKQSIEGLSSGMVLVERQLRMTIPLVKQGAASDVEVLRLQTQLNDLRNRLNDTKTQYYVRAREELARANSELEAQRSVTEGRADSLTRLKFISPVHGVVKNIEVTTVGGVIPPNGRLMTIVPLDDQMLIEAKISPRDVAFIHPGEKALVKITAYDYSIYGGLPGVVSTISPDTIQDDVRRDVYYYRVYIRTDANYLVNKKKERLPIFPGMISSVDIRTGSKSILDYLIKPFNKAQEALRER